MTEKKKRLPPLTLNLEFGEALARLVQTDPKEILEATVSEVLQRRKTADKHLADAKKELQDGARPRKGRFRL